MERRKKWTTNNINRISWISIQHTHTQYTYHNEDDFPSSFERSSQVIHSMIGLNMNWQRRRWHTSTPPHNQDLADPSEATKRDLLRWMHAPLQSVCQAAAAAVHHQMTGDDRKSHTKTKPIWMVCCFLSSCRVYLSLSLALFPSVDHATSFLFLEFCVFLDALKLFSQKFRFSSFSSSSIRLQILSYVMLRCVRAVCC